MTLLTRSIIASSAAVIVGLTMTSSLVAQNSRPAVPHYAGPRADAPVPRSGLTPKKGRAAVVVTDPQNDFLNPKGVAWGVVGQSVQENKTADISQVILAGMSANLGTESHMRELLEQGFEVVVVTDATAAAKLPGFDGYEAAFVNFRLMAGDVWSTAQTVKILAAIK
jgi:nicotinamidase-related amidase